MTFLLYYALNFCTTKYFFYIKNNDATIELNVNDGLHMMVRDPNQIHSTIITTKPTRELIHNPTAAWLQLKV